MMNLLKVVENPPRNINNSGIAKLEKLVELAEQKEAARYKRSASQNPPQQHSHYWWENL